MKSANLPSVLLVTPDNTLITKTGQSVNAYLKERRSKLKPTTLPQEVVLLDRAYAVELMERSERLARLETYGYNLAA